METLLQQNYWHVYSDGIQADIPFCSDEDKIFALNSVAIVAFCTGMTVLCVVVNDTHLHAVLYGTRGLECKDELYFAEPRENGKALGELSVRGKKALFHTNVKLPDSWRVDNDGMLVPASFMDIRHVENLFASPKAFLAFL